MATDTKQRILDSALRLFARDGVAATTVVAIEREAGLSPGSGSFYRHYKDKDEVLRAVIEREVGRVEAARAVRASSASLEDEYLQVLGGLDDMARLVELLAREGSGRAEILDPVRAAMAEAGTAEIAARIADRLEPDPDGGAGNDMDVEAVATVVMFALVGHYLAEHFFGLPIGVERERFVAALADLVRGRSAPGEGDATGD